MKKKILYIFAVLTAVLAATAVPGIALSRNATDRNASAARQKARYYYLEGLRRQVEGHGAEAYEYYRKAYQLDTAYDEAASAFGQQRLTLALDTMRTDTELKRSAALLRPFVDKYPGDTEEAQYYAYVAAQLDSVNEAIRIYERLDSLQPSKTSTLIMLADAYYSQGRDSAAMAALDKYETIEGKSPQLTLKKIGFLINRHDTVAAIEECRELVQSNLREPSYRLMMGNMYSLTGNNDSTLIYYLDAERIAPDYGPAKLALADYYQTAGDSVMYDTKTYEALLSEDFDVEQKTAVLEQYLQTLITDKQDTGRGDHLFQVLSEQYPHEPMLLDLAARYSAAKGDFGKAVENVDYAIGLTPTNNQLWMRKMQYYIADDKPDEALRTFAESKKFMPSPDSDLTLLAAIAAQQADKYDTAAGYYYEIVRQTAPSLPLDGRLTAKMVPAELTFEDLQKISSMLTAAADCRYNAGRPDKAFDDYENALLLNPDNELAMNNYAYFLSQSGGDLARAEEMSRKSLEGENADNPTYLDTYACILHLLGNDAEAHKYQAAALEKAEAEDAASADLYEHFGDILMSEGDRAGAVENWKKALELEPDNKDEIKRKIQDAKK